jgi:cytochrome b
LSTRPLEEAWAALHATVTAGWYVGTRSEWTAEGMTEEGCDREMARCLREISEGE